MVKVKPKNPRIIFASPHTKTKQTIWVDSNGKQIEKDPPSSVVYPFPLVDLQRYEPPKTHNEIMYEQFEGIDQIRFEQTEGMTYMIPLEQQGFDFSYENNLDDDGYLNSLQFNDF